MKIYWLIPTYLSRPPRGLEINKIRRVEGARKEAEAAAAAYRQELGADYSVVFITDRQAMDYVRYKEFPHGDDDQ